MLSFNEDEIQRYSRHITLPEVGGAGQEMIREASVLVVGAGGLGSPSALYLAAAGVGTIGLADNDRVDLSNLQRQILHRTGDVGKEKTTSGKETIQRINPDVDVIEHKIRLDSKNIQDIVKRYDIIIEGSDNFPTKFLVNDACVFEKKPLIMGGILRFFGQTMVILPGETACYRCVFVKPPAEGSVPSCQQAGVLGAIAGFIGIIQATEALKWILNKGKLLTDCILTLDAFTMTVRRAEFQKNEKCPVCSEDPVIKKLVDYEQKCHL